MLVRFAFFFLSAVLCLGQSKTESCRTEEEENRVDNRSTNHDHDVKSLPWNSTESLAERRTFENLRRSGDYKQIFTLNKSEDGGTDEITKEGRSKSNTRPTNGGCTDDECGNYDEGESDARNVISGNLEKVNDENISKKSLHHEINPQRHEYHTGGDLPTSREEEPGDLGKKLKFRFNNEKDSEKDFSEYLNGSKKKNDLEEDSILNERKDIQSSEEKKKKESCTLKRNNKQKKKETIEECNSYEEGFSGIEQSEQPNDKGNIDSEQTFVYNKINEKNFLVIGTPEAEINGKTSKENFLREEKDKKTTGSYRNREFVQKQSEGMTSKENFNSKPTSELISEHGQEQFEQQESDSKENFKEQKADRTNIRNVDLKEESRGTNSIENLVNGENVQRNCSQNFHDGLNKGVNSKENVYEQPDNPEITQRFSLRGLFPLPNDFEQAKVTGNVPPKETFVADSEIRNVSEVDSKENNDYQVYSVPNKDFTENLEKKKELASKVSFSKNHKSHEEIQGPRGHKAYEEHGRRQNNGRYSITSGNQWNPITSGKYDDRRLRFQSNDRSEFHENFRRNSHSKGKVNTDDKNHQDEINYLFNDRRSEQKMTEKVRRDFDSKESFNQNQWHYVTTQRYDNRQTNFPSNHRSDENKMDSQKEDSRRDLHSKENHNQNQWNRPTTGMYGDYETNFPSNDRFEREKKIHIEGKNSRESFYQDLGYWNSESQSNRRRKNSKEQNNNSDGWRKNSKEIFELNETSYEKSNSARSEESNGQQNNSKKTSNEASTVVDDNRKSSPSKVLGGNSREAPIPTEKCGQDVPRRIIGGSSTDIDEFPWLTLLQYVDPSGKVSHDCSGVLISKRYVLTAAHCTHGLGVVSKQMKLQKVRLGEWDKATNKDCQGDVCSPQPQEIEVEDVIPHEKYEAKDKSQVNDIALVRLGQEAVLSQFVQPICLPFGEIGNTNYEDKRLTVSGWGKTSNARDSSSNIKMKVDLPVVNWNKCREFYKSFYGDLNISSSQFCAGGEEGKDSCQGDSGGPLMTTEKSQSEMKWYVVGIVSSGPAACGVHDRPSLYTNVSRFTHWILSNVKK